MTRAAYLVAFLAGFAFGVSPVVSVGSPLTTLPSLVHGYVWIFGPFGFWTGLLASSALMGAALTAVLWGGKRMATKPEVAA